VFSARSALLKDITVGGVTTLRGRGKASGVRGQWGSRSSSSV